MKKLWWSALCILLLFGCTTPEKKAKEILDEFSKELTAITNVENLSAYDLSNRIDEAYARLLENQKKARKELKKAEQKELFDEALDINEVPVYFSLLEALTNKQLAVLENMKGNVWINAQSEKISSMFMIDSKNLSFINLSNKFAYELVNGKIVFKRGNESTPLFFDLEGNNVNIRNEKGENCIYKKMPIENAIWGDWNGDFLCMTVFQKNGKGIKQGINWKDDFTYKINKNKVTVKYPGVKGVDVFSYIAPQKLKQIECRYDGVVDRQYERRTDRGPEALNFLFDGNLKNTEAEKVQVSYTSSAKDKASKADVKAGNDWDSVLDDYEEYFDKYVKLLKKAQSGDVSALTEYAEMLEKAQSIGSKLESAKGELTPKQSARFLKIQQKLLNAASDL